MQFPIPLSNNHLREVEHGTNRALSQRMKSRNSIWMGFRPLVAVAICSSAGYADLGSRWLAPESPLNSSEATEVVCRTEWTEGDEAFSVLPVDPPSLDWGSLELLRTESGITVESFHIDHVFALTVAVPGRYRLPAIDIAYVESEGADLEGTPTVQAASLEIEVREPNKPLYSALAAAAATGIVAVIVVALRIRHSRGKARVQTAVARPSSGDAKAALNRARTLRADGDFYACYQALGEAVATLGGAHEALVDDLAARAQAAGYGGSRPDDTLLDSDFRAVERAMNQAESEMDSDIEATDSQHKAGEL